MTNLKQQEHTKDFSKHATQLREKAIELGHGVQELGDITKEMARDTVGLLGDNATASYRQGVKTAKKWEESIEEKIRRNPLQSLLIAAGVGLLLGAILKKR